MRACVRVCVCVCVCVFEIQFFTHVQVVAIMDNTRFLFAKSHVVYSNYHDTLNDRLAAIKFRTNLVRFGRLEGRRSVRA